MAKTRIEHFHWEEFLAEVNQSITPGNVVLDAGAGDGAWKKKIISPVEYISMDLGVGDATLDYSHLSINGDLRNIPLKSDTVDTVICIQVLEHVTEPWVVLNEFFRVLKPGGILFLTCPQGVPLHQEPYDFYRYTHYGLKFLIERSGFHSEWIRPQQGDIAKTSNDVKLISNQLYDESKFFLGLLMQVFGTLFRWTFMHLDKRFVLNTTGYFLKAIKLNGE